MTKYRLGPRITPGDPLPPAGTPVMRFRRGFTEYTVCYVTADGRVARRSVSWPGNTLAEALAELPLDATAGQRAWVEPRDPARLDYDLYRIVPANPACPEEEL